MTAVPARRTCQVRFHGRLDRFLPYAKRGRRFDLAFDGEPALKDPLESAGVPHTEVARVLLDGVDAPLDTRLRGGEQVEVFPVMTQEPGHPPAFVLDVHLGRLAGYLRLLGIDTLYANDAGDELLAAIADEQERVLLSRDTGLLKRSIVRRGAFVYATDPLQQLVQTVERFGLYRSLAPFTRCRHCNAPVLPVDADEVASQLPACVRERGAPTSRCTGCGHVYWRGTHEQRLLDRLARVGLHLRPAPQPCESSGIQPHA